jgi:hypothetical protein
VLEDTRALPSMMDGRPYQAAHLAATLRRQLWREHMGLLPSQSLDASNDANAQPPGDCPNDVLPGPEFDFVADPLSDAVWNMWTSRAHKNTEIFRRLFRADPDDSGTFRYPALLCLFLFFFFFFPFLIFDFAMKLLLYMRKRSCLLLCSPRRRANVSRFIFTRLFFFLLLR